jgi:hypothetical protein
MMRLENDKGDFGSICESIFAKCVPPLGTRWAPPFLFWDARPWREQAEYYTTLPNDLFDQFVVCFWLVDHKPRISLGCVLPVLATSQTNNFHHCCGYVAKL